MKEGTPTQAISAGEMPEDINFHTVQEERRKTLPEVLKDTPEAYRTDVQKVLDEAEEKASQFNKENFPTLSVAKERLRADKKQSEQNRFLDQSAIEKEISDFSEFDNLSKKLSDSEDFEMTLLHRKRIDPNTKTLDSILKTVGKEKANIEQKLNNLEKENPTDFRAYELVSYKRDLIEEGHIAHTPSVEKEIKEIGDRTLVGKPMFLHGPTGTGKTSLARYAAKHFTGKDPEMVYCTPQTKESHIWGKTGIRPTENGQIETVDIFGPLAKAMSNGCCVIFDEFTALPPEQMVFIKGIMNAKVGDKVSVVGNGHIEIKPGFQIICTANLKSDKNPERASLPPEIAREFEQNNLEINYTPKEEAYDIMLARLMNPDGSLDISYEDLNTTLTKFAEAMDEIQIAYTDKVSSDTAKLAGAMDVSGKVPGLKKLVLTQGTVEAIMDAWKSEKQINSKHISFLEFLDKRLQTTLTFKEYSEADRVLTAKILASKGFLRTLSPADIGLPANVLDFDVAKKMRGEDLVKELKTKSADEKHITLSELATIDPFNRRGQKAREDALDFLPEEEKVKTKIKKKVEKESIESPNTNMTQFLAETYKGWGVNQTQIDAINWSQIIFSPKMTDYEAKKADIDVSKYGEYVLNPDTKDINWDNVPQSKIKTVELPKNMIGKELSEIGEYLKTAYGNKYEFPGLEYYKYIIENPSKAPDSLKDGSYHFFFGSLFRYSDGRWRVPCVSGDTSGFNRRGYRLDRGWSSHYRVVLLEK